MAQGGVFDEVAPLYDQIRPGYAPEVIEAIAELAALPPAARILEIGCGTGQMTLPLAARGHAIVALEPGRAMAALAAHKCRPYPCVQIVAEAFEAWPVTPRAFDLVLSAQAFHWIAPDYGCAKAAVLLETGGAIALVWHVDVSEHTAFWQATLPVYDAYFPHRPGDDGSLDPKIDLCREALARSPAFGDLRQWRRRWEHDYGRAGYLGLLQTFSNCRALSAADRAAFLAAIAERIDRAGGTVRRHYETRLLVARRRPRPAEDRR